jgi:hypothetical protein
MLYDWSLILEDKECVTQQAEFILCLEVKQNRIQKFSSFEWRTDEVKVLCELFRTAEIRKNKRKTCKSLVGQYWDKTREQIETSLSLS